MHPFESGGHPLIFLRLSFSSSGAGMAAAWQHICNDLKRQMCGLPIRKQPFFCNHLWKGSLKQCPMLHLAAVLISRRQSGNEWMGESNLLTMQIFNSYVKCSCTAWKRETEWDKHCLGPFCSEAITSLISPSKCTFLFPLTTPVVRSCKHAGLGNLINNALCRTP